ncbi:A24 family peptidase [Streptomyces sp. NPDC001904]|uniref:prepilin peptidase n=1 Tax=Streptomyces sp. NPDC001904 TaxID=3154531 RepID=UPI00332424C4
MWMTVAAAVVWGALAGWLILPAAYRLAIPVGGSRPTRCPDGHLLAEGMHGWITGPYCRGGAHFYRAGRAGWGAPLATALACLALAASTGLRPELLVWMLILPWGVLLAVIDVRVHRLPDLLTLPLAAAAISLLGVAALFPGAGGSWQTAVLGSLSMSGLFLLMFLISPKAMGFGDVKLSLALGGVLGWYGWGALLVGLFAGYLIAAIHGIVLMVRGKASRSTALPFGPALLAGTLVGAIWGGTV